MIKTIPSILLLWCVLNTPVLHANKISEITVSLETADIELTASCFLTDSEDVIVFMPHVYVPLDEQKIFTHEIAQQKLSACISHAFTDLFLPQSDVSYNDIPLESMLGLLKNIHHKSRKSLYLIAHGTAARFAYKLANQALLTTGSNKTPLNALILMSPNLLADTPAPGGQQRYISLIHQKNLPIFIFQPTYSPHHWHLETLIQQIKSSGTNLFYQRLQDVRDGYSLREDRSKQEQLLRNETGVLLQSAIQKISDSH